MKIRPLFFFVSLALSTLCLGAGYGLANQWTGTGLAVLIFVVWLAGWKYRAPFLAYSCLMAVVCLAAAGLLSGNTYWLMITGWGFALAVWDVLLHEINFPNAPADQNKETFEKKHLQSLALAIGVGLAVAIPLHWVTLDIPFIVMLMLVVLAGLAIVRVWGYLRKRQERIP